jgi:hypothetical protein
VSCHVPRIILKPGRNAGFIFCATHHHSGVDLITELVTIGIIEQDGVAAMTEFILSSLVLPALVGVGIIVALKLIWGDLTR